MRLIRSTSYSAKEVAERRRAILLAMTQHDRRITGFEHWLRKVTGLADLYQLLQRIEQTRTQQQQCLTDLNELLADSSFELRQVWCQFRSTGGVTVRDL